MTATLSSTQESAIRDWLAAHPTLAVGVGSEESACSIAAINMALSGTLTDEVPPCMSLVIGRWIIGVQDAMPDEIRNSDAWRDLLPLAAGTGRTRESERLALVRDWLYGTALPIVQPVADEHGFGEAWRTMCEQRTSETANAAIRDAIAAAYSAVYAANAAYSAASAVYAANAAAAADAARAAANAAVSADNAADAADAASASADYAAHAVAYARSADNAADDAWATFDPVGLLRRLIAVTDDRVEVGA